MHRILLGILVGAAALSVLPDQQRAEAQETVSSWYYVPGTAPATRQPRTAGSAHFALLEPPLTLSGGFTPGTNASIFTQFCDPWCGTNPNPPVVYRLAFVSISGGAGGDITVFPAPTLPPTVPVPIPTTGTPFIAVNVYYFPTGGGGACPPTEVCPTGAFIDEIGELQGELLDDTFVNVDIPPSTTPDAGLTNTGNVDGTVDTTSNGVSINAYATTTTGGTFDRWATLPEGTIGTPANDLEVAKLTPDYAWAFYHTACPAGSTWTTTPTISQCKINPTCPSGSFWNPTTKRCQVDPNPGPVCHWCAKGQICTEVGLECDCLRCVSEGGGITRPSVIEKIK